jgi:hypothetical protein
LAREQVTMDGDDGRAALGGSITISSGVCTTTSSGSGCSCLWPDKKDKSYVCPSHLMLVSWCLVMLNTMFFLHYFS